MRNFEKTVIIKDLLKTKDEEKFVRVGGTYTVMVINEMKV